MHHPHPPTLYLSPPQCLWQNIFALLLICAWVCALWSAFISLQVWKHIRSVSQWMCTYTRTHTHSFVVTEVHRCVAKCAGVCDICMHDVCVCVCQWDVCGGPSGHPCHAMVPVKCCQRGRCGLPWRLKACCTALPAQAADLRKGNLGRSNGGVAPELFTEPSTGPAPPTIFHMRNSVCVVPVVWCVWVLGVEGGGGVSVRVYVNARAFMRKCRL